MISKEHMLAYLEMAGYVRLVEECLTLIRDTPGDDALERLYDLTAVLGPIIGTNC